LIYQAEDGYISGNIITGFGQLNQPKKKSSEAGTSSEAGGITVRYAKNVYIFDNVIDQYAQVAIILTYGVHDCKIFQNRICDARGAWSPGGLTAIQLQSWGLYGISIKDNIVEPSSPIWVPKHFVRAGNPAISVQISNNTVKHTFNSALYYDLNYLPVEKSSVPTKNLTQKYGDIIFTDKGKPGWYVSNPKVGYGSLITSVIAKVIIGADKRVTIVPDPDPKLKDNYLRLPEGMNIIVAGAGPSDGPLNARILKNDGHALTLDPPAEASVVGKVLELRYMGLTIDPL
jgi:hypothetical protein